MVVLALSRMTRLRSIRSRVATLDTWRFPAACISPSPMAVSCHWGGSDLLLYLTGEVTDGGLFLVSIPGTPTFMHENSTISADRYTDEQRYATDRNSVTVVFPRRSFGVNYVASSAIRRDGCPQADALSLQSARQVCALGGLVLALLWPRYAHESY